MRATNLDDAVNFFAAHAGFNYDPRTETPDQGKARTGRELAAAEMCATEPRWTMPWEC